MSYHLTLDALYSKNIESIANKTYDFIVIGAGAYGVSFVHRIKENNPEAKILILEKGNFLLPEHFQNQKSCYIDTFNESFATPWIVNNSEGLSYFGQRPYVGGRALFWNAWTPQPKKFRKWPNAVVDDLIGYWKDAKAFMGVSKLSDMPGVNSELSNDARNKVDEYITATNNIYDKIDSAEELEGELAIKSKEKEWCRFSPVEPLVQLIKKYPSNIDLITNCEVNSITTESQSVEFLNTNLGVIYVNKASVIAANGVFEPFITLKNAFPDNTNMGKNLLGHFRSQLLVRVPKNNKSSFQSNQIGALYIPGNINGREFHIHLSSYSTNNGTNNNEFLYKRLPDATFLPVCVDPNYNYYLLQGMAEYLGYLENTNVNNNYLEMKSYYPDNTGQIIGIVNIDLTPDEHHVWDEMDEAMIQLANQLENPKKEMEVFYQHNPYELKGDWILPKKPLSKDIIVDQEKQSRLSETMKGKSMMHEGGVFWMGEKSSESVTDLYGKLHESDNLYILGSAVFPTIGSWNPTLTGVALTFRTADKLAK